MTPVARYWDGAAWTDIGTLLPGSLPFEAWHVVGAAGEPAFQNGWKNTAGYRTLAFRKTPDGRVEFRGFLDGTAVAAGGYSVFTLPVGYRPAEYVELRGLMYRPAVGFLATEISINASGVVALYAYTAAGMYQFPWTWTQFDDVSFPLDNQTWPSGPAGGASASRVTSLPASPYDGQEVVYVADATAGVLWRLRYNAGSPSAYKWEFIGGAALEASVDTLQQTTSTTSTDLPTVVGLTLPLAGDYDFAHGFGFGDISPASYHFTVLEIGGVDWVPSAIQVYPGATVMAGVMARRRLALSAGVVVKQQYYSGSAGATSRWANRWLKAQPVRVG